MPAGPRLDPSESPVAARFGRLRIEYAARAAALDGRELSLTRSEFDLLAILTRSPRVVITRERLLSELWETTWLGDVTSIEVHVSRLRSKLGESGLRWHFIRTVRGLGYMFALEPDEVTWADGSAGPTVAVALPSSISDASITIPVIAFVGATGLLAWVSQSALGLLGVAPADLVGSLWTSLAHPDDLPVLAAAWVGAMSLQPQVLQVRMRDGAGRHPAMWTYLTPMTAEDGTLSGAVVEWHLVDRPPGFSAEFDS